MSEKDVSSLEKTFQLPESSMTDIGSNLNKRNTEIEHNCSVVNTTGNSLFLFSIGIILPLLFNYLHASNIFY